MLAVFIFCHLHYLQFLFMYISPSYSRLGQFFKRFTKGEPFGGPRKHFSVHHLNTLNDQSNRLNGHIKLTFEVRLLTVGYAVLWMAGHTAATRRLHALSTCALQKKSTVVIKSVIHTMIGGQQFKNTLSTICTTFKYSHKLSAVCGPPPLDMHQTQTST